MFRLSLTFLLLTLYLNRVNAQKESANWFFSQGLGLSFVSNNTPQNITGFPAATLSPSTVVSDANGNLQFIFTPGRVYNRNYVQMPRSSLFQTGVAWNLLLAAPVPSSTSRYYLFYVTDGNQGLFQLRYAVVDMSLNGGLGDVVSADNFIDDKLSPAYTLVNRNGSDEFWVVGHKKGTTTFDCFKVTSAGIATSPVISQAGTNPNLYEYNFHDLKTSPNGKMIAGIGYYLDMSTFFWLERFFLEVFYFDSQTGVITNKVRTLTSGYIYQDSHYCCFSPDNRLIYANFATVAPNLQPCGVAGTNLFQYNLCYNNPDTFTLYAPMIAQTTAICTYPFWGKMQIGMDKKIYMPYAGSFTLSAIDFPNRIGNSSKTNFPEFTLPKPADFAIPDFYHYYIYKGAGNNILYNGGCYPIPTHFKITNDAITNMQWDFGDPGSGGSNTAASATADHLFSNPGMYTVTARLYSPTNALLEILTELVEIKDPAKRLLDAYPKDTTFCGGDSKLLKLSVVNGIFSWHFRAADGNYIKAGISDSIYIGGLGTGTYYVQMRQNDCDGCRMEDSIHVTVLPRPSFSLGYDSYVCTGDSLPLRVYADGADITWSTGATTPTIYVKQAGTYSATAEYNHNGCPRSDAIIITERQGVDFSLPGDTTLCNNSTLLLKPAVPQATYTWQNYSSASSFLVNKPGTYWVKVTNSNYCTKSDTIKVDYISASSVSLGADIAVCQGDSIELQPALPAGTYLWNTGSTDPAITVKTSGTYWLKVDNGVCTVTDTLEAAFNPRPLVNLGYDVDLCEGQTLVLRSSVIQAAPLWQDASTADTLLVSAPGEYWLQETVNNCAVRDTVTISYRPRPGLSLGKDTALCPGQQLTVTANDPSIQSLLWQDQSGGNSFTIKDQGIYWVKVMGNNGCPNADTINVAITPLPDFTLGHDTVLCDQQPLNYNFKKTGASYLWNTGEQVGQHAIHTAGEYWLKVTEQGCSRSDTINVSYKPLPVIQLGDDTSLCEGATKLLSPGPSAYTYSWQDKSSDVSYLVNHEGLYSVTATLNGCAQKDSIFVSYIYKPVFSLVHDTMVCKGLSILLDPAIHNASFQWQDGSAGATLNVKEAGLYSLTATNQCGSHSDSTTVVEGSCKVLLPNAFTPNNDGRNDYFGLKYPEIVKVFRLVIFNRWGDAIFETTNPYKTWDGRYKGTNAPIGTYVWIMSYTDLFGYNGNANGSLILLR